MAVFGLGLSALTALWMTAATFDLLPVDEANPVMPAAISGEVGLSPAAMVALQETEVADLRDPPPHSPRRAGHGLRWPRNDTGRYAEDAY